VMLRYRYYRSGQVCGILYTFEHAGEALPEHSHDDVSTAHNIIALEGQVNLVFGADDFRTINAGEIVDFDGTRRHRIIASTAAVILNLFLSGTPEGYDRLPPSELEGVIKS
jgi:quercetin dioxygenase-like cupin family protein